MTIAMITGITGMVGSHLADYLLKTTDWSIHGLLRWRSPLDNIADLINRSSDHERVKFYYGDIRDPYSIQLAFSESKPDIVFHLAAQSFPKTSFESPLDTFETNINGTTNILEAIRKYASHAIVHICSSSEIFGKVSRDNIPIREDCNFHPASPYAISKVGTDLLSRFYWEAYGLKTLTTRMFTHTGPRRGDVFAESSFAKQIALAEAGYIKPIIKVGNLESLRTVADVRDAIRAYHLLVTKNPIYGESYNIGGNHICTVRDILEHLISISTLGNKLKYVLDKDRLRPIDADLQVPDVSKFVEHTGWQPIYTFEQTMLDLLNFWRIKIKNSGNSFLLR